LTIGNRTAKSEILIIPNRKGLILGIDWLRQQGCFQWDFDKSRIRFGEDDWIELCQENRSIRRIRPVLSDLNEESDSALESNYVPVRKLNQETSFSVLTIVRGSNYVEYNELPVPVQRKLNEFLMPVQRKLDEDCVPVQHEEECECKSELGSTSARVPESVSSLSSASSPVGRARPVRAWNKVRVKYQRLSMRKGKAAAMDRGSSPILEAGKAAVMSRGSSLAGEAAVMVRRSSLILGTGKAAVTGRGSSLIPEAGKAAVMGGGSSLILMMIS